MGFSSINFRRNRKRVALSHGAAVAALRAWMALTGAHGRLALMALALVWTVLAAPAPAQEQVVEKEWNRGYHGLAALCRALGLQVIPASEVETWLALPPRQTMLVALGAVDRPPVDLENYVQRGGAVLAATDRGERSTMRLPGVFLTRGPLSAAADDMAFQGFRDCPLVREFDAEHPLTRGLQSVAANRPGAIYLTGSTNRFGWRGLARLPELHSRAGPSAFRTDNGPFLMTARTTAAGGREVLLADQSVFANQMLLCEDNAGLAINILTWLREPARAHVLILDERAVIAPSAPEEVAVEIPPPTPEQVVEALRNLPPELLVDFGNAALASIEDEGVPNDLIAFVMSRIPHRHYQRLFLLLATLALGVVAVRRFFADLASDGAVTDRGKLSPRESLRRRAARERQQAARELLERFRADVAETNEVPWKVFASRLRVVGHPWQTRRLQRTILQASRRLGPDTPRYWSRRRLARLDRQLRVGRQLRTSGNLEYRPPNVA